MTATLALVVAIEFEHLSPKLSDFSADLWKELECEVSVPVESHCHTWHPQLVDSGKRE